MVTYRISHALWNKGRKSLATLIQSLSSRNFGADIHPACKIARGTTVAATSSIVIGETATVGRNCRISHGVTLGGTGKDAGDRHPKVGNGVFLRSGCTCLGNIIIGDGAEIQNGAVVTKPVPYFTRVSGIPAKFVKQLPKRDVLCFANDPHRFTDLDLEDDNCDEEDE